MTDPADRLPWLRAPLILLYGDLGTRKTTLCVEAFPGALVLGREGALLAPATYLHLDGPLLPRVLATASLERVVELIPEAKAKGYKAVVVDDLSLAAEYTEVGLDEVWGNQGGAVFAKWREVRRLVVRLREAAREAGLPVLLNAHERGPTWGKDGALEYLGGPMLPSKNLTASIPYECDLVLRAARDEHGRAILLRDGAVWAAKDRLSSTLAGANPPSLRAVLGHAGVPMQRARGLGWQDAVVGALRAKLADPGADPEEVYEAGWVRLREKLPDASEAHYSWAFREAQGRAVLARGLARRFRDDVFVAPPPPPRKPGEGEEL